MYRLMSHDKRVGVTLWVQVSDSLKECRMCGQGAGPPQGVGPGSWRGVPTGRGRGECAVTMLPPPALGNLNQPGRHHLLRDTSSPVIREVREGPGEG